MRRSDKRSRKSPADFRRTAACRHAEFAYGITDWWKAAALYRSRSTGRSAPLRRRQNPQPVRGPGRRQTQFLLWRQFRAATRCRGSLRRHGGWRYGRLSASVTPSGNSSSTRSWIRASARAAKRISRRRSGSPAISATMVCRSRIFRRFRQDRRFPAATATKPAIVCGHGFQSGRRRRRAWRRLRLHRRIGPARRQGDHRLRIPGARQGRRRQYGAEAQHGDGGAIDAGRLEHEIANHHDALSREARSAYAARLSGRICLPYLEKCLSSPCQPSK